MRIAFPPKYVIKVYGASSKSNIQKNQIMQNRTTLHNKHYHTPTKLLHKSLNLLQITDIAPLFQLRYVHNHQHGKLPFFLTMNISSGNIHNIFTRNRNQIHLKKTQTNTGSNCIKITDVTLYNSLPLNIKYSKTLSFTSF